ncbi:MAG: ABC transporter ATP-binding protein [Armatimonadota bacterium]
MSEQLPQSIRAAVNQLHPGAEVRVSARGDLRDGGAFGDQWLLLAGDRLLVCTDGEASQVTADLPLADIASFEIDNLVGGASLRAVVNGRRIDLIPFTNALADRFGRVREQLDDAVKGKPIREREEKVTRCPTCGLVLGEYTRVCPRCLRRGAVIRRLLGYARPYRGRLSLIMVLMVCGTAVGLAPPLLTKYLVDDVLVPRRNFHLLFILVAGLASTSILSTAMDIWRGRLSAWLGGRISFDLRAELYERLQWLSMRYYDKHPTGALISRLTQDSGGVQDLLAFALPMIISSVIQIIGVGVVLFSLNWKLAILALLPVPLLLMLSHSLWRRLRKAWHSFWYRWGRFHTLVNDALNRVKVTKAFSQQPSEILRYSGRNDDLRFAAVLAEQTSATMFPIMWLVVGSGSLLIWLFGGLLAIRGQITAGDVVAFLGYVGMIQFPLHFLSQVTQWLSRALTAAERVFEVLDTESDSEKTKGALSPERLRGEVEFQNVNFGYERHQQVLKDVSFRVEPGQMVGLVGKSGAGKTTIINLLCRFYDADEGMVRVDGGDIRELALWEFRQRLGVVLQEAFLFSGTVAENIAYGKPDATTEEIMAAAKLANAHDFVVNKPDGYDEQVGEHGGRLSAGERQRICIARAILRDPAILILDEATASVDLETEQQIQEAITRLIEGRTTFAIAHRLSTLRNAHQLLVLEDGKIVENGTHEELEAKDGVYAKLLGMHRETSMIGALHAD